MTAEDIRLEEARTRRVHWKRWGPYLSERAGREHFECGARDMAQSETQYARSLSRLLTHPVKGVENFEQLYETLTSIRE
jgi:hypothetical protein